MKIANITVTPTTPRYQQLLSAILLVLGAAITEQGQLIDFVINVLELPALAEYLQAATPASWVGLIPIVLGFLVQALKWRRDHGESATTAGNGDVSIFVQDDIEKD